MFKTMSILSKACLIVRESGDKYLVEMRTTLETISRKPNVWTNSDPCLEGENMMIFLHECRQCFSSSLDAYTILASEARCRRVERLGEAVGLHILTTSALFHLECEEEKARHRLAGDENLEVIRSILEGRCSPEVLTGECQKLFFLFDKVLDSCFRFDFTNFTCLSASQIS